MKGAFDSGMNVERCREVNNKSRDALATALEDLCALDGLEDLDDSLPLIVEMIQTMANSLDSCLQIEKEIRQKIKDAMAEIPSKASKN
jgi:hypothetical protein